MRGPSPWQEADAFDLPEWLGTGAVTWSSTVPLRSGHRVGGVLSGGGAELACDLLAVDEAWPLPVADQELRTAAHQAWRRGEVLLVEVEGRLALAVPGCDFTADQTLVAVERLARAVGASPSSYAVCLTVGQAED